jgi:hypothetical protein
MSYHVCFHCACGEVDFGASARFTYVVWDDLTGLLDKVAPNPYRWCRNLPGQEVVDGGEFHRWWESYLVALNEARDRLPTMYEIWQPLGEFEGSAAGYFRLHGDAYMAYASYDDLKALELDERLSQLPPADLPYAPPEVEQVDAGLADELFLRAFPDRGGRNEIRLTADEFERIFRGTPLRLEHGNLLDFYADELRELSDAARHAAERGETIEFYQY